MGTIDFGGNHLFTLEPPWLNNEPQTSCIPVGAYPLPLAWSNRYAQLMPRVLYVPNREGILIHPGNYPGNTHGCILLGRSATADAVYDSRGAWGFFSDWLGKAWAEDVVYIEIDWEKA